MRLSAILYCLIVDSRFIIDTSPSLDRPNRLTLQLSSIWRIHCKSRGCFCDFCTWLERFDAQSTWFFSHIYRLALRMGHETFLDCNFDEVFPHSLPFSWSLVLDILRYSCCFFAGFSAKFNQSLAIWVLLCWFWLRLKLFESIQLFLVQILHWRVSRYSFIDRHEWSTPNMIFFGHCSIGCLYCSSILRRADSTFPPCIEYIIVSVELLTTLIDNNILNTCRSQSGKVVSKRTLGHLCLWCSATLLIEPRKLKADIRLATACL